MTPPPRHTCPGEIRGSFYGDGVRQRQRQRWRQEGLPGGAVIFNHRGDDAALGVTCRRGPLLRHRGPNVEDELVSPPHPPPSAFQCSDGNSAQENSSLKRVAVVEDFFDIIYAMHVEMGADPGRAPKHAGQKKTYKAVSGSRAVGA